MQNIVLNDNNNYWTLKASQNGINGKYSKNIKWKQ